MSEAINSPEAKSRRFRHYPKYKDSGIEWLGEIPAHWDVRRIKHVAPIRTSKLKAKPEQVTYLGLEQIESWTGRLLLVDLPETIESVVGSFCAGDVLFGKLRPYLAKAARPEFDGVCTSELLALHPTEQYSSGYLFYCLINAAFIRWLNSLTYGTKMPRVSPDQVGGSSMPLPSLLEQRAIAAFLDRETAKIDALIEKNERLIELLQEERTALITQAVTKGLDPTVPIKDSGIEWLGKIPADWTCLALSRVTLARCDGPFGSGLKSEHYSESGVRVVRLQNIGSAEFFDTDRAYINEEHRSQLGDHSVFPGDLLIAGLGDDAHPVGRACVAPEYIAPAIVKADCFRFRLDVRLLLPRFGAYQLSVMAAAAAGAFSTGATRSRLNLTEMATRKVALPPLEEQVAIVSILDQRCDESCAVIAKIQEAIDRLKEYRTALISAAVIGKIDARELVRFDNNISPLD